MKQAATVYEKPGFFKKRLIILMSLEIDKLDDTNLPENRGQVKIPV
jgi:hypothetical protein